ncbi:MAG: tRNA (adenosine(37)-N6)-dimethylallyltransferase MiaA [Candidatus Jorgensenbacteria bacterium]
MRKLIAIVGPTGSGKSALAVTLAKRFKGEVISADSRHVYRGLDVGSNKITRREMRGVPHYLLDVASPRRTFTAAQYQKLARRKAREIWRRGKIPILCGGTGLYVQAAIDGTAMPAVKSNPALRKKLAKRSAGELFALLEQKDPARAASIDPKNPRRLIRALEIVEALGRVPRPQTNPLPANVLMLGISVEKRVLERQMRARIRQWLRRGLLKEVGNLLKQNVPERRIREFGLVYALALKLFKKEIGKEAFYDSLALDLKRYTKRQMTWFRRDRRIQWLKNPHLALKLADKFLVEK